MNNLRDREVAFWRLVSLGNVWIGPDMVLKRSLVVPPLGIIRGALIVRKGDFPDIDLTSGAFGCFNWSVRSCLAQSGVEVRFHRSDVTEKMLRDIGRGRPVAIPVAIQSHVRRPIKLCDGLMRFFWVNDLKRLRHDDLRKALGSDLVIEGQEGKDWSFGDIDMEDDVDRVVEMVDPRLLKDVCIKLPLQSKFYIPRSKLPLHVKSKKDLPTVLRKIPKGRQVEFSIGETASVSLGPNIVAVINTGVYDRSKRHIMSPLIDPRFTGVIRTETVGGQDYIELFLYRK